MATAKRPDDKNVNGLGTRVTSYFRSVYAEMKKVHWPNRKQIVAYTGVVLVAVALVSVLIWIVDSGLAFAMEKLLGYFGK